MIQYYTYFRGQLILIQINKQVHNNKVMINGIYQAEVRRVLKILYLKIKTIKVRYKIKL